MSAYLIALATFGCVYGILALGLNLSWGMTGLANLGLAGFYGLGAYASALSVTRLGFPIPLGFVLAVVLSAIAGALVALCTGRLRDDYLAIVTLGFAEVVRLVLSNEIWLTGGTDGVSGIPGPFRTQAGSGFNLAYLAISAVLLAIAFAVAERIARSPYGRVLRAIRDDEPVAASSGKRVLRFKIKAFGAGAGLSGLAGALYAHYTSYVAPDNFVPLVAIYVFLALTLGGTGSNRGALLGAFLLVFLLESTRFLAGEITFLSGVQIAAAREIVIGILLLLVLRFRRSGLVPERGWAVAGAPPAHRGGHDKGGLV